MIQIAYSPCPNDTFAFAALAEGIISSPLSLEHVLLDIENLNKQAQQQRHAITKMSASCFAKVQGSYELLTVGTALGFDVGPKLISASPIPLEQLVDTPIAHPGENTTAFALLRILAPKAKRLVSMRYDCIPQAVSQGIVHAGVIIHESRFTFHQLGLIEILDLGRAYCERYQTPLPLGVFAIQKNAVQYKHSIETTLQHSLDYALHNWEAVMPYIRSFAKELDDTVIKRHIQLYVNEETRSLSPRGRQAIENFIQLLYDTGLA